MWDSIVEGSKNVSNSIGTIKRRFQPCIPPEGYGCIEYKVMDNMPIFGSVDTEDIIVRICYPSHIDLDVEEIVKDTVSQWLKTCLETATKDATKAFVGTVLLTAWGAFVGSISAAISAAVSTFQNSLLSCLATPPTEVKINGYEIIPTVYMRKHSMFIPGGNNCFPMYSNWGKEPGQR